MTTLSTPLVEVRLLVLRRTKFLAEALDSVLAQTYEGWRMVVQENGEGSDAIRDLLQPYLADERITHEVEGELVPQWLNWTNAVSRSNGRYVALLHDDDTWDPDWLERRVTFLEEHPDCGFAFASNREIDLDGNEIRRRKFMLPAGRNEPEAVTRALYTTNFIQPPAIIVRSSAYDLVDGRFEGTHPHHMDYHMWVKLATRSPAGYFHVHDSAWRVHELALTAELPAMGEHHLRFYRDMEREIAEAQPDLVLEDRVRRAKWSQTHIKAALDRTQAGERRAALRHVRAALRWERAAAADPRLPFVLAGLVGGRRMGVALARLRDFVRRHEINVHIRDRPI